MISVLSKVLNQHDKKTSVICKTKFETNIDGKAQVYIVQDAPVFFPSDFFRKKFSTVNLAPIILTEKKPSVRILEDYIPVW